MKFFVSIFSCKFAVKFIVFDRSFTVILHFWPYLKKLKTFVKKNSKI